MSRLRGIYGVACLLGAGCGGGVPAPKAALEAYCRAAERGDAQAIYEMLTPEGKQALTRGQVKAIVTEARTELRDQGRALLSESAVTRTRVVVRFSDGESASLRLEDGQYRIDRTFALPAVASTPEEALSELRRAIARRSYIALLQILSPTARESVEGDMRALVLGLEKPEALDIEIVGDTAVVEVPGGHKVTLRREGRIWGVEDFN